MDAVAFLKRTINADAGLLALARTQADTLWRAMLIGILWAAVMLLIRFAASSLYQEITGFVILLPGVILAALAGGRAAGVTALVACLAGGWALVGMTDGGATMGARLNMVATVNFVIVGLFSTVVAASLRKSLRRLDNSVAAQKAADARIDETEIELRAMVEQASAGIVRVGLDGVIQSANARFAEILGSTPEKLIGATTADLTHPDDVNPTKALLASALEGGAGQVEKRYYRADGSVVWAITSLQRLLDPDGAPRGFIAVIVDISEAKATEAALRESEERFRLMADTAPSPVWLTNEAGEVEFVNKALVTFYDQPAEALMGQMWKATIHPDDQAAVAAVVASARPQRLPYVFECRFQRGDGVWRWTRVSVNPRFDGESEFRGYVGMAFDVTETREALEALARQERRQTFLLSLSDRLRELSQPQEVMAEVNASLGRALKVSRAAFGELDTEAGLYRLYPDWTDKVASLQGELEVSSFGGEVDQELLQGLLVVVDDASADPRTASTASSYAAIDVGAFAIAPLMRAGRLRAFLGIQSVTPRVWTADELGLLDEVAERAWVEVERTRAQSEVIEGAARLAKLAAERDAILGQLGEGVIVTDPQGAITFVNEAASRLHGVADLGVGPLNYSQTYNLLTDDGRPHPAQDPPLSRAVLHGEIVTDARWRIRRTDGSEVLAVGNARPVLGPDGSRIGAVLTLRDETARIAAEHRISESEARFRTVADSAPVFIWMTDADTRIIFANERYRAVFGVDVGEIMGGRWRKRVHHDDLGPFSESFLKAMKTRSRFEAVMRVNHPTEGLRWLRSEGIPRFDAAGVFEGYVGASLDITEAKQAEDDLKRINELLEERVGEALAEKAKAEADLMHAQRMEAVGRLTGGVAHDFNNLLTVVIGALDMILRSPDDAARRKKLGEAALAAARRGEGLTHQLLAFSRRQALRPQPTDLNALVVEGEPLLRRAVGEAIDFQLELRDGGACVSIDPAQFEAALLNLLVNARDAVTSRVNRDGGERGRISLQTSHCEIEPGEVLEMTSGDYVCVTVSDNGAGMDEATLARVFEPFFTTKAVGKGTGLGLSQVYGFARQSGGGVRIISAPGEGTQIRVYLPPLDPAEVMAPASDRSASEIIPGGRRLLLVEDDAGVSAIAVELLIGLGLEVEAVETGPDALAALADRRFDVMLSDVVMPGGMTGIELARICAERYPDLRILLTSGYAGDDVDEALSDAPWPFLRKPYSGEQLRQALGDLLPLDRTQP